MSVGGDFPIGVCFSFQSYYICNKGRGDGVQGVIAEASGCKFYVCGHWAQPNGPGPVGSTRWARLLKPIKRTMALGGGRGGPRAYCKCNNCRIRSTLLCVVVRFYNVFHNYLAPLCGAWAIRHPWAKPYMTCYEVWGQNRLGAHWARPVGAGPREEGSHPFGEISHQALGPPPPPFGETDSCHQSPFGPDPPHPVSCW